MRIRTEIKLDFSDVLLQPHISNIESRNDINLIRTFTYPYGKSSEELIPIVASNMASVATFDMARALSNQKMMCAIHKYYPVDQLIDFFNSEESKFSFYTMGMGEEDYKKFKQVKESVGISKICLDVPNGYIQKFVNYVRRIREENPDVIIMAGNVVSEDITTQLVLAGADIVKVGIGSGCLAGDSRVLMSNGTYKNIKDVQVGDRIITQNGDPATVKRSFCSGFKKIRKIKHVNFYKDLEITSNHECFVGDLSTVSKETVSNTGYKHILNKPDIFNNSKLKWEEVDKLNHNTFLSPKNINWELPLYFNFNISKFFQKEKEEINYNIEIASSYELGYMFGFFLGDGNSHISNYKKSTRGSVHWSLGLKENKYAEKLSNCIHKITGKLPVINMKKNILHVNLYSKQWAHLFDEFNKRENKYLPEKYMCLDKDYNKGLFDGLVDSDGHVEECGRITFTNTSKALIELFNFVTKIIFNSFPNNISCGYRNSKLVKAKNESFSARLNVSHEKRLLDKYQIIKPLHIGAEEELLIPVYDLEIDHPSHSFIVNNMIVHNSACTTRRLTGVGFPQLSAIIECADAAHGLGGHICSDGGIVYPGDVAKAFAGGADFVMMGGMFAGHDECGGEIIEKNGKSFMKFYGMSSYEAQKKHYEEMKEYRASEGRQILVPYRGPVKSTVKEILGGLRSTCAYIGAGKLKELPKRATFIRVNNQINQVFENNQTF